MAAPSSDFSGPAGPVDGKNLINIPGGAGVSSLNTRAGAIVLAGSASVTITEAPLNTFTFTASVPANVSSFNTKTGAIVVAAGANISIVEAPANTFTIAATIPAALTSLNGDTTAAQVIAAGTGISIVDVGATHTINNIASVSLVGMSSHTNSSDGTFFSLWNDGSVGPGNEADAEISMPAGTLSALRFRISPAPAIGESAGMTIRKNGVSTALTCSITGDGIIVTASDLVNSVTFNDGDTMAILFNKVGVTVTGQSVTLKYSM
jgi:hypothetical protein